MWGEKTARPDEIVMTALDNFVLDKVTKVINILKGLSLMTTLEY